MRVFTARSSKRFFFIPPFEEQRRAGSRRNRDNEWYSFHEYRNEFSLFVPRACRLFLASWEKLRWWKLWTALFDPLSREREKRERDYITVILISIVNTRTKLTLSSEGGKFGEWRRGVGWVLVEEKLIELVIDGRGYRPLSRNFKMSCKWNVIWSVDGMLEHLDRGE